MPRYNKRVVMRIELTPASKKRLTEVSQRRGMTQVAVASRLVEWFALQPEAIQATIIGLYPAEIEADVARLILRRLADSKKGETGAVGAYKA